MRSLRNHLRSAFVLGALVFGSTVWSGEVFAQQCADVEDVIEYFINTYAVAISVTIPSKADAYGKKARDSSAVGSGTIIDPKGFISTNAHVVRDAKEVTVILPDGTALRGRVVKTDEDDSGLGSDLAIIKVDLPAGFQPKPLRFANSDTIRVGAPVYAIGNPVGKGISATAGIISRKEKPEDYKGIPFLRTDAAINPGNSGGALITCDGALVGIPTQIFRGAGSGPSLEGLGFAIPSSYAQRVLAFLKLGKEGGKGIIGARFLATPEALREARGIPGTMKGFTLDRVDPKGPAAQAGLEDGDFVIAVNGEPVTTIPALELAVRFAEASIVLRVFRGGEETNITVTVIQMPASTQSTND